MSPATLLHVSSIIFLAHSEDIVYHEETRSEQDLAVKLNEVRTATITVIV